MRAERRNALPDNLPLVNRAPFFLKDTTRQSRLKCSISDISCLDFLDTQIRSVYSFFVEKEGRSLCRSVASGVASIMEVEADDKKCHG